MSSASRILAGAMSGTSADGVDVALVEITGRGLEMSARFLHHHARPYDAGLRKAIFAVREAGNISLAQLAALGREISLSYAAAINAALSEAGLRGSDLAAVAAHGQTLYHEPPSTIQWFDPALVAAEVGCPVISDFRRADCAAGGQGAPLVPFADYILFRHPTKNRVLLNIGGIANLTYLPGSGSIDQIIAFDTGPGNCICDDLCRRHQPDGPGFDEGGRQAEAGTVSSPLLSVALAADYFARVPPKSTDGPAMVAVFEAARALVDPQRRLPLQDLLGTAALLTVQTIHAAIFRLWKARPMAPSDLELVVSGGGTLNRFIMRYLAFEFPVKVLNTEELGIPAQSKEAIAFALLGAAALDGVPSNVPSATGAKRAVVLGSITPKP